MKKNSDEATAKKSAMKDLTPQKAVKGGGKSKPGTGGGTDL